MKYKFATMKSDTEKAVVCAASKYGETPRIGFSNVAQF